MSTVFLKPRLVGARFAQHSIPVEVLQDWSVFEGLIVEAARWIYLQKNPDRQRTPRGFLRSFTLNLTGIEAGSAVAVFERSQASGELVPDAMAVWFDQARDLVLDAIHAAGQDQPIDTLFPKHLLGYFDRFGRALHDDERIEFSHDLAQPVVVYDKRVRKKLVLGSATEYRTEEYVRGSMSELDQEKRSFTLKLIDGDRIAGMFTEELREAAVNALASYGESLVIVEGAVVRDQLDNRKRIEQVSRIEPLDPLDVPARLEAISLLRDGWLDGEGVRLSADGLAWLSSAWSDSWPADLPLPYAYPMPSGLIQLEWTMTDAAVSVEVDMQLKAADLLASGAADGEILREVRLDLSTSAGWQQLADSIRPHAAVVE